MIIVVIRPEPRHGSDDNDDVYVREHAFDRT